MLEEVLSGEALKAEAGWAGAELLAALAEYLLIGAAALEVEVAGAFWGVFLSAGGAEDAVGGGGGGGCQVEGEGIHGDDEVSLGHEGLEIGKA